MELDVNIIAVEEFIHSDEFCQFILDKSGLSVAAFIL